VKWGWIHHNPAALASITGRPAADRPVMSDDELLAVLAAAPHTRATVMLRIAAATGARRAELAALQWSDLDGARLTIAAQITVYQQGSKAVPHSPVLKEN
jgi:integrase